MNITRRSAIKQFALGAGASLLGPLVQRLSAERAGLPPKRFAFLYTPNGYNQAAFLPKAAGTNLELTPTLAPLAAVKDRVALVTGLDRQFVSGTGVLWN